MCESRGRERLPCMRLVARVALLALLAALLGCDRVSGIQVRHRPTPAPTASCVRAALAHSPDVLEWAPWQAPWGGPADTSRFRVSFRDSTGRRGIRPGAVLTLEPTAGGARVPRLGLQYVPQSPAEPTQASRLAYRLLAFVTATCGMRAVTPPPE